MAFIVFRLPARSSCFGRPRRERWGSGLAHDGNARRARGRRPPAAPAECDSGTARAARRSARTRHARRADWAPRATCSAARGPSMRYWWLRCKHNRRETWNWLINKEEKNKMRKIKNKENLNNEKQWLLFTCWLKETRHDGSRVLDSRRFERLHLKLLAHVFRFLRGPNTHEASILPVRSYTTTSTLYFIHYIP